MNNRAMNTVFKIDLLKGQGVPFRNGPVDIALAVISVVVPIVLVITIVGLYMHNKVVISQKQKEITTLTEKTDKLSDAVEQQKRLEMEKIHYGVCLSEVKSSIEKFSQWSPILTTLVENMPNSVVLTKLEVEQDTLKKKVPGKDNPDIMEEIDTYVTTMRVTVSDSSLSNSDKAVKEFHDYICSSALLGPKLDKVGVSKESGTLEGEDVVYYLIDCVFKAEL